ncbi:MAG: phosphate acyltransferase PlsX [Balneolaceae bacterium]|nr:MAG: phosphate acyltransferase PlsX [Balneolaceae bacterium]
MLIAVDAVGGDHYPERPVQGAIEATKEDKDLRILLLGPEELIKKELSGKDYDTSRIHIHHAPEIIGMDESPASAVKTKQQSSITLGISAHKQGKCDAFVSAGNTGALLAASTFILGKLEGVIRPTIAVTYPTIKGVSLLADAGANLELKPEMYLQVAKMCEIFARDIMGIEKPTVGLINIGEEAEKGLELHKEVHKKLAGLPNFAGNIEGKDILFGKGDIYLTDGFTGNVILKFGESMPDVLKYLLKKTMTEDNLSDEQQKLVFSVIAKTMDTFNYERVGGLPFLGVNGVSLVGHGGSSVTAIKNMIHNAVNCIDSEINKKIVSSLNN